MKFNHVEDVKMFVSLLKRQFDKDSKYHLELKWFEQVNYTTTTEYYGELLILLKEIQDNSNVVLYKQDIDNLINILSNILK